MDEHGGEHVVSYNYFKIRLAGRAPPTLAGAAVSNGFPLTRPYTWQSVHLSFFQLDGERVFPPAFPHDGLRVTLRTSRIFLETDFGLSVAFDGAGNAGNIRT